MKPLLLLFVSLASICLLHSQELVFVKDSIMTGYMRSGYANEHFKSELKTNEPKQGRWQFYELKRQTTLVLKDGKPEAVSGEFLLYAEGNYLDGNREGKWNFYVLEDKSFRKILSRIYIYSKGAIVDHVECYLPDGKLAHICPVQNGLFEGESTLYYPDGKIYGKIPYKADKYNGAAQYYYPDGKLLRVTNYTMGIVNGKYIVYYPNGKIQERYTNIQGNIDGIYQYYYPSGQLWTERVYRNNLLMMVNFTYDKNGRELDKGRMNEGNGRVKFYNEEGTLYLISTYKDGIVVKEENKQ